MIGETHGRLTVLSLHHKDTKHHKFYTCRCECGNTKIIRGAALKSGNTKSCGCLSKEVKKSRRLPDDQGVINQIILQYKRHAKNRNIPWALTKDQARSLLLSSCYYCGEIAGNLKRTKNHPGFKHNGIDRKDHTSEYSISNCVPCCGLCNRAKGTLSEFAFVALCKKVSEQWGSLE